jgi:hypothetical protein
VTEVLDLLAMWALLQVLFVWCFARAAGLRAHGYEGEIRPVDTRAQPGYTASPYIRSNPGSTTNLCKRGLGDGSQRVTVTVSVSLRRPSDESEQGGVQAPRRTVAEGSRPRRRPCQRSSGGS